MIGDDPLQLTIKNTSPPKVASPHPYQRSLSRRHPGPQWHLVLRHLLPRPAGVCQARGLHLQLAGPRADARASGSRGITARPGRLRRCRRRSRCFPNRAKFMGPVKMGAPHFVDFGKNMEHSPDGKAYLLGMGAEENDPNRAPASSRAAGQVFELNPDARRLRPRQPELDLRRPGLSGPRHASPGDDQRPQGYEFFAGHDAAGKPVWTAILRRSSR